MRGGVARAALERLDDVRGRADVGVAAPEVDEGLAVLGRSLGDAPEQPSEVLLREALEAGRARAHGRDASPAPSPADTVEAFDRLA